MNDSPISNDQAKWDIQNDGMNIEPKQSIENTIIDFSISVHNQSFDSILFNLDNLLHLTSKYEIPLNSSIKSYNFPQILITLYDDQNLEISIRVQRLIYQISKYPKSNLIEYLLETDFCNKLFSLFPLDSKQLRYHLQCIRNIIHDFSKIIDFIYSENKINEYFLPLINSPDLTHCNCELLLAILSMISKAEYSIKTKTCLIDLCVQALKNDQLAENWAFFLNIISEMVINNEIFDYIIINNKELLIISQSFIRSNDPTLIEASVRFIGKRFLYTNDLILCLDDHESVDFRNCIDYRKIMKCVSSDSSDLCYICIWFLSIVLAINSEMISIVEQNGNIYQILTGFCDQDRKWICKLEACKAMYSIILLGSTTQIEKAIQANFIEHLVAALECDENTMFAEKAFYAIDYLLNVKSPRMGNGYSDLCWKQFLQSEGPSRVEDFADEMDKPSISKKAQIILNKAQNFERE